MHRDKKVGLALAILLCSIVGAFFFRDDAPRNKAPELKDPERIDQELTQGSRGGRHSPYTDADQPSRRGEARRTEHPRTTVDQNDLPDFLRDNPPTGSSTVQRPRVNGSRDPFTDNEPTTLAPPQDAPAVPIPLHNSEWEIAGSDNSTGRRGGTDVTTATTSKSRTHVVADGDTLSSIAGKYLGSQARYQEIFQANRDQLQSPNDLKIGMKLTIPDRTEGRTTSGPRGAANSSRPSSEQTIKTLRPVTPPTKANEPPSRPAASSDSPTNKPKFKPAKAGPAIRRTSDASDDEGLGKTLSQVPPPDVSAVDEGLLAELEADLEPQLAEKPSDVAATK